ncbi:hypothetical protein [Synechococcus phage S-B05]|jgi:hypothetical protein|nr:hypothetical protein [Synechococcus phage S-B05]
MKRMMNGGHANYSTTTMRTMELADFLVWICVPFVVTTLCFGFIKGENDYYDSDDYDGNGTAH